MTLQLTCQQIQQIIPHRFPFLLVDRIVELDPGRRAVGIKAVSIGEPFFVGHFPQYPVMPGVLVVEALAQVGGIMAFYPSDESQPSGQIGFLAGVDGFRFRRQVVPGDLLRLEVELAWKRGRAGKVSGRATVDGEVAAEGDITFVSGPVPDPSV